MVHLTLNTAKKEKKKEKENMLSFQTKLTVKDCYSENSNMNINSLKINELIQSSQEAVYFFNSPTAENISI